MDGADVQITADAPTHDATVGTGHAAGFRPIGRRIADPPA